MKKRWIGPPNPDPGAGLEDAGHDVVVAGRAIGHVVHGSVLEIPDAVWAQIVAEAAEHGMPLPVWPPDLWEDVAPPKRMTGEN